MPRKAKVPLGQTSFLEANTTAPAVPAIREVVKQWCTSGYPGATETSRRLLEYWFNTDHKLPNGTLFRYNTTQISSCSSVSRPTLRAA